ncbi:hypothetical protein F441_09441 [Phytophthora nicotianae CJ01A1]|uniref:Uncharacterized protein n=2 Tax=Phytophthora nicotianae CJ01A1 TaxID=1317063 RepID=W2WZD7_PHYNI|nr:hypothetical protein F441_09441 [Phytophthora nicotianae CJ01A1]
MEEENAPLQKANNENGDGVEAKYYPDGYDATYADYYYQQQQEGEDYYASYQQEGYDGYYSHDPNSTDPYQYQYSYEANDAFATAEGQDYSYYTGGEGYEADQQEYNTTHMPESWSYSPEDGQQLYLDQLTTEQTSGYYYDEQGNLINVHGGESPTNVFNQEEYWQGSSNSSYIEETTSVTKDESPQNATDTEELGVTDFTPTTDDVPTPDLESSLKTKKKKKNDRAVSPSKKKKTKKERIEQRQALLEKEEEERLKAQESAQVTTSNKNAPGTDGAAASNKTSKLTTKKTAFLDRERAKFQLKLRITKAIKRNRMPVQIRILPTTRKHLTPMDKYFGSKSVECVLSDIFWASIKGDIGRMKHLVEVEGESPTDSKLDPWNLHQTPLHWAAKGGSVPVVSYLLAAGASPRCLDDNGSLPLHLSCWAGHVDASILLLRASDVKDLYVQDYDGAMCPLDWANVRGHTKLLKAIEKYQDSLWLPKFVDELIRGIVRYKIKIFKDPPKKPVKAEEKDTPVGSEAKLDPVPTIVESADNAAENLAKEIANTSTDSLE